MSTLQRRTLWRQGRAAWEAWSLGVLEKKKALEEGGAWAVDWFGEGQNEQTKAWLHEAAADFTGVEFGEEDADFSGFVFPGPANFDGARFGQANFTEVRFATNASFAGAQFRHGVTFAGASFGGFSRFDDALIVREASFEGARFIKESNGPLSPSASFCRTAFRQKADFRAAKFTGTADFKKALFAETARFDEAELSGAGHFGSAQFSGLVSFRKTRFGAAADFSEALFTGDVRFGETGFAGPACFDGVRFGGETSFRDAQFQTESEFAGVRFDADARFDAVRFGGRANFSSARFGRNVSFQAARFEADGRFRDARFGADAQFADARFLGDARFAVTRFSGSAYFFRCVFSKDADFQSMTADVAFVLAGARFARVPAFHEASFRAPPQLDNLSIRDPLRRFRRWSKLEHKDPRPLFLRWMKVAQDPDMSSRYRRLRRLAADANDHECEQDFFAEELRCRRFWRERALGEGFAKFWLAWAYGGISDFGRSMLRPFLAWTFSVVVFALFYLGRRPGGEPAAGAAHPEFPRPDFFWLPPKPFTWDQGLHWMGQFFTWMWGAARWAGDWVAARFITNACIEGASNPVGEAFYLSLKNALIMVQWENDQAARRVYGCLYGVKDGGAVTPLASSLAHLCQMAVSAPLIFLFLLALRNLLKVK